MTSGRPTSCLVLRETVHRIKPSLSIVDERQLKGTVDISAAEDEVEAVEGGQSPVEWRRRSNLNSSMSSSSVPAKTNSCMLPPSSSGTKELSGRAQSEVFHVTTNGAGSSLSGGTLTPNDVDGDHGMVEFRVVCRDNLGGGTCSGSVSSTLFQFPECFSECGFTTDGGDWNDTPDVPVLPTFDDPRPTMPPQSDSGFDDRLSNLALNSPAADDELPEQRDDADSSQVPAVQLPSPSPQTTVNDRNDVVDVSDDEEDEGEGLFISISGHLTSCTIITSVTNMSKGVVGFTARSTVCHKCRKRLKKVLSFAGRSRNMKGFSHIS